MVREPFRCWIEDQVPMAELGRWLAAKREWETGLVRHRGPAHR